jgi:hypothetical protein
LSGDFESLQRQLGELADGIADGAIGVTVLITRLDNTVGVVTADGAMSDWVAEEDDGRDVDARVCASEASSEGGILDDAVGAGVDDGVDDCEPLLDEAAG